MTKEQRAEIRRKAEAALDVDYISPTRVAFDATAHPAAILSILDQIDEMDRVLRDALKLLEVAAKFSDLFARTYKGELEAARAALEKCRGEDE